MCQYHLSNTVTLNWYPKLLGLKKKKNKKKIKKKCLKVTTHICFESSCAFDYQKVRLPFFFPSVHCIFCIFLDIWQNWLSVKTKQVKTGEFLREVMSYTPNTTDHGSKVAISLKIMTKKKKKGKKWLWKANWFYIPSFLHNINIPVSMASVSFFFHCSATSFAKGSSGLGALSNAWIDSNTVLIWRAGLHLSEWQKSD